jgi:predicted dehydrogenase
MIKVGLIGLGGMGRTHFNCYKNCPGATLAAICDIDPAKLRGDWSGVSLNLDPTKSGLVDLGGIATYSQIEEILADPDIDMIDICLPTSLHAQVAVDAMRAGKHVFCEKPMALNEQECLQMEEAQRETGQQLMIGHCLRYWPEYVVTEELIRGGEYGKVLSASFHRSSGKPLGSYNNWFLDAAQSGGVVLDMHIHDIDTALWWFGQPDSIETDGLIWQGLPYSVDATWRYNSGPVVNLHGSWDPHGGPFRMAFRVVMEKATVVYDSVGNVFRLLQLTPEGDSSRDLEAPKGSAYQNEINDFVACLNEGKTPKRVTSQSSRLSVAVSRQEMGQIESKNTGQV